MAAWRLLTSIQGRLGDTERTAGHFDRAASAYAEAEVIQRRFLDKAPGDQDWLNELSWTHNRMGDNLLQITNHEGLVAVPADRTSTPGDPGAAAAALDRYKESVKIRSDLVEADQQNSERKRNLAWSLTLNGMALLPSDTQHARAMLERAMTLIDKTLDADPKNTEALRYRALMCNFLGDALLLENQPAEAVARYEEGLSIRRRLTGIGPANSRWWRDLFYTLVRMAEVHTIMGNADKAREYRAQALEVGERASKKFPTDGVLAKAIAGLRDRKD
jgi:tetratricopeptide (TPR) repeat protein